MRTHEEILRYLLVGAVLSVVLFVAVTQAVNVSIGAGPVDLSIQTWLAALAIIMPILSMTHTWYGGAAVILIVIIYITLITKNDLPNVHRVAGYVVLNSLWLWMGFFLVSTS